MAKAAIANKGDSSGIEFSIYAFEQPNGNNGSRPSWKKAGTKDERQSALTEAETLFSSGKYQKVEVKQKYYDKKKNRNIDVTLRVFESKAKRQVNITAVLLVAALVSGGIAFAITYFLTK